MPEISAAGSSTGTYDVDAIAELLGCSSRHVRRLADAGAMPRPLHLGRLVRWRRADVDEWLAAGCPPCRPVPKARAT
ncbi:MAG: helix-turn-helix domain-containing protein [Planctomycetota bacterium]